MAINASSNNPLYLAYRNSGPTFALIGPSILIWLIGICGFLFNSFVILTTYLSASLRGTANYLMALICLAEAIHQLGHSIFLAVAVSGINFIDLQLAVWLTLPQYFCMGISLMGMLLVALDRLLAVSTDTFHNNLCLVHKKAYLALLTVLMLIFGIICSYFVISNGQKYAGTPTTACLAEVLPLSGDLRTCWFLLLVLPLFLSGICYLIIGAIIRCNKSVSSKTNMHLLRSLFIILCVNIGGYALNLTIYEVLSNVNFSLDFISIWQLSFISGALLNISAASNAPILYVNSTEYRKAFRQFYSSFSNGNQIHSSNVLRQSQQQVRHSSIHSNSQNQIQHISSLNNSSSLRHLKNNNKNIINQHRKISVLTKNFC